MEAELYTWSSCPFCNRAKAILDKKGVPYTEHVMDGKDKELRAIKEKYGHSTVPIILIDGRFIGGCSDLESLAARGGLKG